MNSEPDDFLAINAQSATMDLTVSSIVTFNNGQDCNITLSFDEADWKRKFNKIGTGAEASMTFAPEIWTRFCKGYLIPTGNNVIFDFANEDFYDCYGYFGDSGQVADASLSVELALPIDELRNGQYAETFHREYNPNIYLDAIIVGQSAHIYNGKALELNTIEVGQSASVAFERRQYNASNGQGAVFRDLAMTEPNVKFITAS
jgi:hypothetical protein